MEPHGTDGGLGSYVVAIKRAYGDLREPNYAFVEAALRRRPYSWLLDRLRQNWTVEEWPHGDDDVALCVKVEVERSNTFWLWVSYIGPFAVLERYRRSGSLRDDVVSSRDLAVAEGIDALYDLIIDAGLELMDPNRLSAPIDFHPVNGAAPVPLYSALFSEVLPSWVS